MPTFKLPSRVTLVVHLCVALFFYAIVTAAGCSSSGGSGTPDASADSSILSDGTFMDKTTSSCTGGKTSCEGTCVNTTNDPKNCGSCGATCGGGLVCSSSTCAVGCQNGQTLCGTGTCTDTMTDFDNCGACGKACQAGQVCSGGMCGTFCNAPNTSCSGSCVNTTNDVNNCGSCGNVCGTGLVCSGSKCVGSCGTLTACATDGGSFCTNTNTDNTNCGTCSNVCPGGQVCSQGMCSVTCGTGTVDCGGKCIDPTSDPSYCGATTGCGVGGSGSAGTPCAAGQACAGGLCAISCPPGQVACSGVCVDPTNDGTHCGATPGCGVGDAGTGGTACAAGLVCSSGSCEANCGGGLVQCTVKGVPTCVDPTTNPSFCGATSGCGVADAGSQGSVCPQGEVCSGSKCGLTCQTGQLLCGGICINPLSDPNHCGAIMGSDCTGINGGEVCNQGHVCVNGMCQVSCVVGQIDCNNQCVDPLSNNQFCSQNAMTCGTACATGTVCEAGICNLTCQAGFINCFGNCINPTNNNSYCGVNGSCTTSPNGTCADGGGACACASGKVCSTSVCGTSCLATEALCSGSCINPQTDSTNCGATPGGTCNSDAGANNAGVDCPLALIGSSCITGNCKCPAGSQNNTEAVCNQVCTDGLTSNLNCGAVGTCSDPSNVSSNYQGASCSGTPAQGGIAGSSCIGGLCTCPIIPGGTSREPVCGGACVDPNSNDQYCGVTDPACGAGSYTDCTKISGSSCVGGKCTCPKTAAGVQEVACGPTTSSPPTQCIDPSTNNGFCNAVAGTPSCTSYKACGALTTCGTDLSPDGGVSYACNDTCTTDQLQCDTMTASPYCANFKTDNSNCGACHTACTAPETCQKTGVAVPDVPANYTCALTCPTGTGWTQCPGSPPYCANILTDSNNCQSAGGCGFPCTNGSQLCSNGTCANTCQSPPDTLCPAAAAPNPGNPYCADFTSDGANCGGCGTTGYGSPNVCPANNHDTSQACMDSHCCSTLAATGFNHWCSSVGCTDTNTDNNNCGTCGTQCGAQTCLHGGCFTHNDGLGDGWNDGATSGTYNQTEATTACLTWATANGVTGGCTDYPATTCAIATGFCGCPTTAAAFVYPTSAPDYFWYYAGTLTGEVAPYSDTAGTCGIPVSWH